MPDDAPVLLYDGACGFCARSVRFVLARDREGGALRFATLQGPVGAAAHRARPALAGIDSVVWYEPAAGRVLVRSEAALAVLRYLGGPWRALAAVGALVPRPVRDAAYALVARNRHRLAGSADGCLLPTPAQRARFLDLPG